MVLLKQVLIDLLQEEEMVISFPNLRFNLDAVMTLPCYQALFQIQCILQEESLCETERLAEIEAALLRFKESGAPHATPYPSR